MQVPFHYTHVEYEKGDFLGFLLSLLSLLPIFLLISYTTLILEKPRTLLVLGLFGQLVNEGLNSLLKNSMKIPRPQLKGKGYGFPSSHSQFMGYFMSYFLLIIMTRKIHKIYYLYYLGLMIAGLGTAYSRIYLNYHTLDQVVVGLILGVGSGLLWGFISLKFEKIQRNGGYQSIKIKK